MNQSFTHTTTNPRLSFAETFTFSAKEKDKETGFSVTSLRSVSSSSLSQCQTSLAWHSLIRRFGSRYYSSDLSIWLSVDPMASKYPSLSPYVYCANNPVKLVDPNGEEINPIYDRLGFFLGTDDLGLKGDFIVMERNNFHQNMSHEEALGKSTCFDMYHYSDAKARCLEHFNTLKDRPDYDGKITLEEANEWYRTGNGQPLFADLTKLDLSGFKSSGESAVGNTYQYNLLTNSGSFDDRLVYGNLTFIRTSNDGVRAFADKYDFDMKNWWNPINWGRNIETIIGKGVAGEGKPYTIFLYGTAKLKRAKYAD